MFKLCSSSLRFTKIITDLGLSYLAHFRFYFIYSRPLAVLVFAGLLLSGYKNTKLNLNISKFFVGTVAGIVNGFGTLAGLPIALYFLIIAAEPAVIRASLAALFFFTDF